MPIAECSNKSRFFDEIQQYFYIKDESIKGLNNEISKFGKDKVSDINQNTANLIAAAVNAKIGNVAKL